MSENQEEPQRAESKQSSVVVMATPEKQPASR